LETNLIEKNNTPRRRRQPKKNGVDLIFRFFIGFPLDDKAKKDHYQKDCTVQECREVIAFYEIVQDHSAYEGDAEVDTDSHQGPLPVRHQFELIHIGKVGISHTDVLSSEEAKIVPEEINPSFPGI
jgi:hypothetical protein